MKIKLLSPLNITSQLERLEILPTWKIDTKCKEEKPQMVETIIQIGKLATAALSCLYILDKAPSRYLLESDWYPFALILMVLWAFLDTLI
jgi:hypothetical protein